jgi:DNA-binding beta-propeller fold protein YncE
MSWRKLLVLLGVAVVAAVFVALAAANDDDDERSDTIALTKLGTHKAAGDVFDEGAAEIAAYDPRSERLFVVNGFENVVDVLDVSDPSLPVKVGELDVSAFGSPNSVAVSKDVVAVVSTAILPGGDDDASQPGTLAFFDADGNVLRPPLTVGATPDMAVFTANADWLLIANEGEPTGYGPGFADPEGSVSVIDMRKGVAKATIRTARFTRFEPRKSALQQAGVRIFGPGATVSQDLEPEYIAVSKDSDTAWVTLQEANAIAEIDVRRAKVEQILPLGTKSHALFANRLDANDQDGVLIDRRQVRGMYQPDAIAVLERGGQTYLFTANEGDVREWPNVLGPGTTAESARASAVASAGKLDGPVPPGLNRLNVTQAPGLAGGDTDGNGKIDVLHTFGARSLSVWSTSGKLLADTGSELEVLTATTPGVRFNASNTNSTLDNRSDDKGPEPEEVELGKVGGRWYAFLALERVGGVAAYDLDDPTHPQLVDYVSGRDFTIADIESPAAGDLGPEGLAFISADDSPTGQPLLAVANEISGTTTLYRIDTLGGEGTGTTRS